MIAKLWIVSYQGGKSRIRDDGHANTVAAEAGGEQWEGMMIDGFQHKVFLPGRNQK
jgi:hypothetical protein